MLKCFLLCILISQKTRTWLCFHRTGQQASPVGEGRNIRNNRASNSVYYYYCHYYCQCYYYLLLSDISLLLKENLEGK